jgi:hypothetical protein
LMRVVMLSACGRKTNEPRAWYGTRTVMLCHQASLQSNMIAASFAMDPVSASGSIATHWRGLR